MIKKKNGLLILVMTLVFAVALTGCDNGSGVGNGGGTGGGAAGVTDLALNGVWRDQSGSQFFFNNGNFDIFVGGMPNSRGTFTTNNNDLIMRMTHIHGNVFLEINLGFGSRWYTVAEIRARAAAAGDWELVYAADRFWIPPQIVSYFISGNTLTLIGEAVGGVQTFQRN